MPVDDEDVVSNIKHAANGPDELCIVHEVEVCVLRFFVRGFFGDETGFEGCEFFLAEERALRPAPEVIDHVGVVVDAEPAFAHGSADDAFEARHEFPAAQVATIDAQRLGRAVFFHGDAGVEEENFVAFCPHAAATDEPLHLLAQFHAAGEAFFHAVDALLFGGAVGVWIARVDGRKVLVKQRVRDAFDVDADGFAIFEADVVQQPAMREVPLGVTLEDSAFSFELHDGDGFLHASNGECIAEAFAFGQKSFARVVVVDIAHEAFDGRHDDAVAFFELAEFAISQAKAQHGEHARLVTQVRADPQHVVVAPQNAAFGLSHQRVDDAVHARAAVA